MTIRAQVTLALCGMVAFSFAIGLGFAVLALREASAQAGRRQHEQEARLVAALASLPDPARQAQPFVAALAASPGMRYAYVSDAEGTVRFHSEPGFAGRKAWEWSAAPKAAGAEETRVRARLGDAAFDAVVGASPARESLAASAWRLAPAFLRVGGFGLVASVLLAWGLAAYLVRPILELADVSRRLGHGELSARIPDPPANELGELARQFNALGPTLQALDELREARVSHVSHDVRSPLAALEMLVEHMLTSDEDSAGLSDGQRGNLQLIRDHARRLRVFAANVLDAAKIRSGRMEYRKLPLELAPAASRVVELFKILAKQKGVAVSADVPPGLRAVADPDRLDQVLANLVSNAVKHTGEGGTVEVTASRARQRAFITVRDTGTGMSANQQQSLFLPFAAGPGPSGETLPSAGLGLFVVRETVTGMGGKLSIDSRLGEGTRVSVELEAA
ncbi:MAG: HAMP domain-containing protein [Elusimicrobia bacterium]|nr:HAMP domain-containing protein [Elusimicrobiota bacterium]